MFSSFDLDAVLICFAWIVCGFLALVLAAIFLFLGAVAFSMLFCGDSKKYKNIDLM
jgi:phage shock protein PspC (stress-responsive transcriptional regulator)